MLLYIGDIIPGQKKAPEISRTSRNVVISEVPNEILVSITIHEISLIFHLLRSLYETTNDTFKNGNGNLRSQKYNNEPQGLNGN